MVIYSQNAVNNNQEVQLANRNDTSQRIQSALWELGNHGRSRDIAELEDGNTVNFAAYIALVMSEADLDEDSGADLSHSIRLRMRNAEAAEYLIDNLDRGLLKLALLLRERFNKEELRDLVMGHDDGRFLGRAAGQYSTPDSICNLAYAVLGIEDGDRVADFGCGRGDFLTGATSKASSLHLYGIDINREVAVLASVRLDLLASEWDIEIGDMLEMEAKGPFDKIFSNFPFGMRPAFMRGKGEYYESLRFGKDGIGRPASADWLFNKLAFDSLADGGKAVTIMANGAAFNGGDMQARKYFVNNGMIKAVVALPANLFPSTGIATVLVVLGKNDGHIRMVDATDLSVSGRRWDTIGDDEIEAILARLESDCDYSRLVDAEELAAAEYNLYPTRYLGRSIELENASSIGELALSIERGASITARDLDTLTVDEDTGLSFLRLSDISDGCIGDDLPHLRELDSKTKKQWLRTGDLIVSKNGAPFKIAVAEVPEGKTILANGNLYIIRLDTERIDPYFVAAFLASDDGKELMERMVVGTTIPNLPLRNLKDIQLPVPDKNVQDAVARRYRARLDEIEVLKIKLEKARIGAASAYDEAVGR